MDIEADSWTTVFKFFLNKISHPPVKPLTVPRLLLSLVLPFTRNYGLQIHQQVTKLLFSLFLI